MLSNNCTEANGKAFVHRIRKLGPQPTFSHLKLGTAIATEYHKHVPNVLATALHFSDMKENLLQVSITVLFIQPEKFRAKANGYLTHLSHRKAISLQISSGIPDTIPPAPPTPTAEGDLTTIHSWAVIEFGGSITLGN